MKSGRLSKGDEGRRRRRMLCSLEELEKRGVERPPIGEQATRRNGGGRGVTIAAEGEGVKEAWPWMVMRKARSMPMEGRQEIVLSITGDGQVRRMGNRWGGG